jgi:ethanolamine kinase
MGANGQANGGGLELPQIRHISHSYDTHNPDESARQLILAVRPLWAGQESNIKVERCKDGITNTLLKVSLELPGQPKDQVEADTLLLRAYGHGTQVLIDRRRELENHELLMVHGLAPELLARFDNGMLYRYIHGTVTSVKDLRKPAVLSAVARRLAEWHATIPCLPRRSTEVQYNGNGNGNGHPGNGSNGKHGLRRDSMDDVAPGKPAPNLWTVMQKWIWALPAATDAQRERQGQLQRELLGLVKNLSQRPGLGKNGVRATTPLSLDLAVSVLTMTQQLVFAHCDLLHGNIIIEPQPEPTEDNPARLTVSFIDYEYATPSPAAFDIANHFAEWAGFECDYDLLPTKSQRRRFIEEYTSQYFDRIPDSQSSSRQADEEDRMFDEVDRYRGIPGFYWGIWALIQAEISDIDFDYASYAEARLAEYWAWKGEMDGSRKAAGKELPLREQLWARA